VRVYLAAPLFSQSERLWNRKLAKGLEEAVPGCQVVLPQDFRVAGKFNDRAQFKKLFNHCQEALRSCDVLLAVLDGADADSGVSYEIGCAYTLGKPVVGLRTDYRQQQERGVNFMVSQACGAYALELAFSEDLNAIIRKVARKLKNLKVGQGK